MYQQGSRQRKKLDYHKKKFENPFFKHKRRSRISVSLKTKLIVAGIMFLIGLAGWFFLFSNYFIIKNIEIIGATRVNIDEIEALALKQTRLTRYFILSQRNAIVFDSDRLLDKLNERYCFEEVSVDIDLPKTIKINIIEKPYAFIWVQNNQYFYADQDGYLVSEVNPLEIKEKKYPLIHNQINYQIVFDNKINLNAKYISFTLRLFESIRANDKQIKIQSDNEEDRIVEKFIIDEDKNTVKIKILNGPFLYFNTEEDLNKQLEKMNVVIREKLKDDFMKKKYIDLRYGDKVYYQ